MALSNVMDISPDLLPFQAVDEAEIPGLCLAEHTDNSYLQLLPFTTCHWDYALTCKSKTKPGVRDYLYDTYAPEANTTCKSRDLVHRAG